MFEEALVYLVLVMKHINLDIVFQHIIIIFEFIDRIENKNLIKNVERK